MGDLTGRGAFVHPWSMRILVLAALLVGCGEVSPAGVAIGDDGGTAGAMAGAGGGGSTGEGGTTGAAGTSGASGSGADALPPSCAYTPEMITGTYPATFTSSRASGGLPIPTACYPGTASAHIVAGNVDGWDRTGFTSGPSDVFNGGTRGTCAVYLGFSRQTAQCMQEIMAARFELPTL